MKNTESEPTPEEDLTSVVDAVISGEHPAAVEHEVATHGAKTVAMILLALLGCLLPHLLLQWLCVGQPLLFSVLLWLDAVLVLCMWGALCVLAYARRKLLGTCALPLLPLALVFALLPPPTVLTALSAVVALVGMLSLVMAVVRSWPLRFVYVALLSAMAVEPLVAGSWSFHRPFVDSDTAVTEPVDEEPEEVGAPHADVFQL